MLAHSLTSIFSKVIQISTLSILTIVFSGVANASGGYGGGGGSYGGGGYSQPKQRVVDQNYEAGKSIYSGRNGAPKLEYCLKDEADAIKVSRSSIKTYKRAKFNDFNNALVECGSNELISNALSRDQFILVSYYLNKRYKLYLN